MKLSIDDLIKVINDNSDKLCIFYINDKGGVLESLDQTNPTSINGNSVQLNCETTKDI